MRPIHGAMIALALAVATGPLPHAGAQTRAGSDIVDTAVAAGSFATLVRAVTEAGLAGALKEPGPFTVFAPTDDAFAELPDGVIASLLEPENAASLARILKYHVVAGEYSAAELARTRTLTTLAGQRLALSFGATGLRADDGRVLTADIRASNGVIHVIDTVLMPASGTVVDIAAEAGTFSTLLAAAEAAGLADVLAGEGPFTVFAPTDDAFGALPDGTVASLLRPENRERLADILKYHVVPGRLYASDLAGGATARTVLGSDVRASVGAGGLLINDAPVEATDIEASNGVVHVIGAVLTPEPRGRRIIGINYAHPSSAQRTLLGLPSDEGIVITGVSRGKGAVGAGLRKNDIIVAIDGGPASLETLRAAIARRGLGAKVDITVARTVPVEVMLEDH